MKILLTGVTGYIGKRLLPVLLAEGHQITVVVRDANRFDKSIFQSNTPEVVEANFLENSTLSSLPDDIDVAYYLIHSMSASVKEFEQFEKVCAENFKNRMNQTRVKQVIYLSGIVNDAQLSVHLRSRKGVEEILQTGIYALTTLRAGIIVGSGSASFEIIRDLVEKLPFMIAPKWLDTKTQPIAIRNVIQFLKGVLGFKKAYNQGFDIGGPKVLTYKQMLLQFAEVRKLKRFIITVPVLTPKLSSYWLYFVTSTNYKLAVNLVNSMRVEVIVKPNQLAEWLNIELISYKTAVKLAFGKIQQQEVVSSWTDALSVNKLEEGMGRFLNVPTYGCLIDNRRYRITSIEKTLDNIWRIGGAHGWFYANWLWEFRGFIDKMVGGVGLRRGRKNQEIIIAGEALDFWRVIYASKSNLRLLLYAEMKLPGEAWLEFSIKNGYLYQVATFRPVGIWGRTYWISLLPFHHFIFGNMIKRIAV